MHALGLPDQATLGLEVLLNGFIRILDILTLKVPDRGDEATRVIHRTWDMTILGHDSVGQTDPVIVLSEPGGIVDNTGTTII